MQHECFLAYAPRGAGLLCAVTYVSGEPDIVGWFVGAKGPLYPSAYFRVENFFSAEQKRFWGDCWFRHLRRLAIRLRSRRQRA